MSLYLGVSQAGGFVGFPLDDAWIHQTYARNLALTGQLAFIPGQPSAGSTSLLWSALLALGYGLRVDYRVWTYGLGGVLLGLNAWLAYRLTLTLWPAWAVAAWGVGAWVALEWHLAWASVSGMETLLFSALALAVFVVPPRQTFGVGVLVGLSVLARPDGLTLLPFALLRVMLPPKQRWRRGVECGLGFVCMFVPYLAFNQSLSGTWWPNTFAAKQAEYAVYREAPLWRRLWEVGVQPWVGAQVLLLPGVVVGQWRVLRQKEWARLLPLAWSMAFLAAYALRLPVTYQHGRYEMPVIPVLVVLGVGGISGLVQLRATTLGVRLVSRVWALTLGVMVLAFWVIGAGAYQRDVQIIETEMVAMARWIRQNTPPQALVAAHDIGALGYWGERDILDLAGLVSPTVIPFIRDEAQIKAWLTASGAQYLMTFPEWYPQLTGGLAAELLFQTAGRYSPEAGGTNLALYRWPGDAPSGAPDSAP